MRLAVLRKRWQNYMNDRKRVLKVKKILYMLQINPCHMSDFGVLLIEVYYLRGGKPCIRF